MKKRKPPVVLATLLIILVGTGVAFNLPTFQKKLGEEGQQEQQPPPQQEAPKPTTATRPAQTKEQIMKGLKTAQGAPSAMPRGHAMGPGAGPNTGEPSIKIPKAAPYNPAPDPNRTSQQWYR